ncbi:MAG: hypothetical protein ABI837_14735, partial [Acidobacteriota bacterium]
LTRTPMRTVDMQRIALWRRPTSTLIGALLAVLATGAMWTTPLDGWESAANPNYIGRSFEQAESDLQKNWNTYRGAAHTEWREVKDATRDSYERIRSRMSTKR